MLLDSHNMCRSQNERLLVQYLCWLRHNLQSVLFGILKENDWEQEEFITWHLQVLLAQCIIHQGSSVAPGRCQRALQHILSPAQNHTMAFIQIPAEDAHLWTGWWGLHWPVPANVHSAQGFGPCAVVLLWFHYKLFLCDLHLHQYCLKLHWYIFCGKKIIIIILNGGWRGCEWRCPPWRKSLSQWPAVQFAVRSPGANGAQRKALTHLRCRQAWLGALIHLLHVVYWLPDGWVRYVPYWSGLASTAFHCLL